MVWTFLELLINYSHHNCLLNPSSWRCAIPGHILPHGDLLHVRPLLQVLPLEDGGQGSTDGMPRDGDVLAALQCLDHLVAYLLAEDLGFLVVRCQQKVQNCKKWPKKHGGKNGSRPKSEDLRSLLLDFLFQVGICQGHLVDLPIKAVKAMSSSII